MTKSRNKRYPLALLSPKKILIQFLGDTKPRTPAMKYELSSNHSKCTLTFHRLCKRKLWKHYIRLLKIFSNRKSETFCVTYTNKTEWFVLVWQVENIQSWLRHLCVLHLKDVHSTTLFRNASERHCAQRSKQRRRPQSAKQQKRGLLELRKHLYIQDPMNC